MTVHQMAVFSYSHIEQRGTKVRTIMRSQRVIGIMRSQRVIVSPVIDNDNDWRDKQLLYCPEHCNPGHALDHLLPSQWSLSPTGDSCVELFL